MATVVEDKTHPEPGHPKHLAHHFETPLQQYESAKSGMWLFLSTEVLLFSGLFCAYAVYRANHPEVFSYAHQYLDKRLGGINTLILILSSFTAAWAVRAAQRNQRRLLIGLIIATLLCAFGFMGIKAVEYEQKWKHGLLWGKRYQPVMEHGAASSGEVSGAMAPPEAAPTESPPAPAATAGEPTDPLQVHSNLRPAAEGPPGLARYQSEGTGHGPEAHNGAATAGEDAHAGAGAPPKNVQVFFSIYFLMTGLHGLHVLGGMVAFSVLLVRARRGDFTSEYFTPVDLTALYWHLVDLVWIYLFPLLYLIH